MAPSVQWSTHLWACKTHEVREVGYDLESDGITYLFWSPGRKIPHLYTQSFLGG